MLEIAFGHSVDILQTCLGPIVSLAATIALRRPTATDRHSGAVVPVTAPDQVAVTGTLANGAVVVVQFRGGTTAGPALEWQILGTSGELRLTSHSGMLQHGKVKLGGSIDGKAHGDDLPIPPALDLVPQLAGAPDSAHSVANAYVRLHADLTTGTTLSPTFTDAVRLHSLLDVVRESAESGRRVPVLS
jgi:predicted dehydrogenase